MLGTAGSLAATLATGAAAGASTLATGIRGILSRPSRKQNSPSLPRGQNSQPSPTNSAQFEFDKLLEKAYQEMQVDQQINPNTMEQLEAAFAKVEKNDNNKELFNHFKKQFYGDENDEGDDESGDESGDDTTEADTPDLTSARPAAAAPGNFYATSNIILPNNKPVTKDNLLDFFKSGSAKSFKGSEGDRLRQFCTLNNIACESLTNDQMRKKIAQSVKTDSGSRNGVQAAIIGKKKR